MPICLFKVSEICCSYDFAHIICTNFLYYGSKDWVPADVIAKCKVTLEFCCAEKQPGNGNSSSINEGRMPYMWCGQLRRTIDLSDKNEDQDNSHLARIAFFQSGVFVVSVCAKVSSQDAPLGIEESWWAPHAKIVRVEELEQ